MNQDNFTPVPQPMPHLASMDILLFIESAIEAITEKHVSNCADRLEQPARSERVLGTIHNQAAIRLWVAYEHTKARAIEVHAKGCITEVIGGDKIESERLHGEYHKFKQSAEIMRDIFWLQVRDDMGQLEACSENGLVGLRAGWTMVIVPKNQNPLASLMGGFPGGGFMGPFRIGESGEDE